MNTEKIEPLSGIYIDRQQLVMQLVNEKARDLDRLMATINMAQVLSEAREWDENPGDFKITNNAVEEASYARLPRKAKRELERIRKKLFAGKKTLVKTLMQYRSRYPEVPFVWNLLSIAFATSGRQEEYETLVRETVQQFPDYLFGKIALAQYYLDQDQHQEIPALLGNKMNIYDHYHTNEREFHYSEVRSFYTVVGCFYARENEIMKAIVCWNLVKQVDEEHGAHRMLAKEIIRSQLARVREDMSQFLQRQELPDGLGERVDESGKEEMDEVGNSGSNKFTVSDRVRVLPGVKDPDFNTDIGGWSGVVAGIEYDDQGEVLYLIRWDKRTLARQGDRYIDRCEEEGLDYEIIWLLEEELELLDCPDKVEEGILLA